MSHLQRVSLSLYRRIFNAIVISGSIAAVIFGFVPRLEHRLREFDGGIAHAEAPGPNTTTTDGTNGTSHSGSLQGYGVGPSGEITQGIMGSVTYVGTPPTPVFNTLPDYFSAQEIAQQKQVDPETANAT